MNNESGNIKHFVSPRTRLVIGVSIAITLALLFFQSIWLAYVLGLLIVVWQASVETRKRIKDFNETRPSGLQEKAEMSGAAGTTFQWLLGYTALFIFVAIPIIYAVHTKTDIELLSREAERYIGENVIDDGSERYCYMDSC